MEKPNIKFGDVLGFSEEWFKVSGCKYSNKRFVATGKIIGTDPDWLVYVVAEGRGYAQAYYHTFLVKA